MRDALTIAILNNMPQAAVRATEQQFSNLLAAAAGPGRNVSVRWFCLHPREGYEPVSALWRETWIDGLIVTGTEPRARVLSDEPYWDDFTATVAWAASCTASTIWSCLAAHAAVLHLDDIERQPLPAKLSGVFASTKVERHPLLAGTGRYWSVPHSRYNDLEMLSLMARRYRILTWSEEAGVDLFIKRCGCSLFIFVQSHPEYDARALMREYRRDVLRFLNGEQAHYPAVPTHYFDSQTEADLRCLQRQAMQDPGPALAEAIKLIVGRALLQAAWQAAAIQIYRNWLNCLAAERTGRALLQTAP